MSEEGAEGVPLNRTGNVATTAAAPLSNAEISTASSSVVGEGESSADKDKAGDSSSKDKEDSSKDNQDSPEQPVKQSPGGGMVRHSNGGSRKSERSTQSYQPLRSLSEVTNVRDLNKDTVRDMLRQATSDHSLELVEMGQLEDMSGLND